VQNLRKTIDAVLSQSARTCFEIGRGGEDGGFGTRVGNLLSLPKKLSSKKNQKKYAQIYG
jgi:hypothetical protein